MINIPNDCLGDEELEHIKVANEILIVDDRRKYLSVIMNRIGKSRETGLEIIVWILSKADEWG
ncbi:hypothetical protein [Alistipes ihumii]|uniref:hypothetical protein n=1 Tax=Alistipes ihumii TaxID=1470347 RepID=UPI0026717F98|nr:hypothetical protein [Alistipes ihumii]